MARLEYLQQKR